VPTSGVGVATPAGRPANRIMFVVRADNNSSLLSPERCATG